jgi:hypothetical protein
MAEIKVTSCSKIDLGQIGEKGASGLNAEVTEIHIVMSGCRGL